MRKVIVLGASGQLGQCLQAEAAIRGLKNLLFFSKCEADLLNIAALRKLFDKFQPDYCINCAAYTAVDQAEQEINIARAINKDGVALLSKLCNSFNSTLVHFSTDFVFEGKAFKLLTETDDTSPINQYGLSKLEGEQGIQKNCVRYYIIRTSWLYSEYGHNFMKTILNLSLQKKELNVVHDQIGTPTYAMDLAACALDIIQANSPKYGIYHYSNEGVASWYDFAKAILQIANRQTQVSPISSPSNHSAKALRPFFSVMDKHKIKHTFGIKIPYWRDSLMRCMQELKQTSANTTASII